MRKLYLVRHAKSDWSQESIPDVDRYLNSRGYENAHYMSKRLNEQKIYPNVICSSPAIRAISTALIFARNLNFNESEIQIVKGLYEASSEFYLNLIASFNDAHKHIFIFGHNPTITHVANILTNTPIDNIPTTGIVAVSFYGDGWRATDKTKLDFFDFPKNHK